MAGKIQSRGDMKEIRCLETETESIQSCECRLPRDNILEMDDLETQRRSVKRLAELKSEECEIYKLLDKRLTSTMSQRGFGSKTPTIKPGFSVADVSRMQTISEKAVTFETKPQSVLSKLDVSGRYEASDSTSTSRPEVQLGFDSKPLPVEKVLRVELKPSAEVKAKTVEFKPPAEVKTKPIELKHASESKTVLNESVESKLKCDGKICEIRKSTDSKMAEAESKRMITKSKLRTTDSKLTVNVMTTPKTDSKQGSLDSRVADVDLETESSESDACECLSPTPEPAAPVEMMPPPPPPPMRPVQLEMRPLSPGNRQTYVPPQPFPQEQNMIPLERRFPPIARYPAPMLMEAKPVNMGPQQVVTRQIVERIIHTPINTANYSLNQLVPVMYAGGLWAVYCFNTVLAYGRSSS